ncbi:hypothetical protein AB8O38_21015 [Saccharomonospora xinjiangensis]|uniref:hypothetical protein n=1 Tax=Saccharomonospora xinjiangensis TaxID=75294 RepID=UPI00350F40EB
MDDTEESRRRSGWGELGHKWITAIAALITALAGAGFFIGRSTAPEDSASASKPEHTVTATVTMRADQPGTNAGATTTKGTTDTTDTTTDAAAEKWAGKLEWSSSLSGYNLDIVPPTYTEGRYLTGYFGLLESYGDAADLVVWKSGSTPGKAECAAAVTEEGSDQVSVVKGNQVCGQTFDGSVFRLEILSSGSEIKANAVIWK